MIAVMSTQSKRHNRTEPIAFFILGLFTLIIVSPVIFILVYIFINGIGAITWDFLTQMPSMAGKAGGIFPAIIGTFYLMLGTLLCALPIGMFAALYLTEYARQNRLVKIINLTIVNLAGVPSIVYGLFGLGFFVLTMNIGMSVLAAILTLSCQALAMMIASSREAIVAVPREYGEASLALGSTKWQTIRHIVLPQSMPGIITGAVLAISRAAGETAPILTVGAAFYLPALPQSPFDQFMALAYHLYTVAANVPGISKTTIWGVALVLIAVVLIFDIGAIIIRMKARQRRHE